MAVKIYQLADIGPIHVYKRRGATNMRLSVAADGKIRITIPHWVPFATGLSFAQSRTAWIVEHMVEPTAAIRDAQKVGKAHHLVFTSGAIDKPTSRIAGSEIIITRPHGMAIGHKEVQKAAERASIRALRAQAESLLPKRLKQLGDKYDFNYNGMQVKRLKGRWGSCDAHQAITLNLFLMQLPWEFIDYVLLHELVHTKHMDHGVGFWTEFLKHEPRAKLLRKGIKNFKPVLETGDARRTVT